MRVYISGPITGRDLLDAKWDFEKAKTEIERRGHTVINPMDMANWCLSWRTYMALAKVTICSGDVDAIYFMDGWTQSRGCLLERKWAHERRIAQVYNDISLFSRVEQEYDYMSPVSTAEV